MAIRNYLKKLGRRAAGTWGRVNHKRDMRAAAKSARKYNKQVAWHQADDDPADIFDEEPH
jgi:hypothetical protein